MTMVQDSISLAPPKAIAAARVSWVAGITFLVLLTLLHVLKPELDPSWRFISEYQIGSHGWLMSLAFLFFALSCLTAYPALRPYIQTKSGKFGLWLLLVTALGLILAAVFPTDPITVRPEEVTASGGIHQLGAMLDTIPFAALLMSWSIARRRKEWHSLRKVLYVTSFIPIIGTLIFMASMASMLPPDGQFGPDVSLGWINRFMITTHCLWLILICFLADRLGSRRV